MTLQISLTEPRDVQLARSRDTATLWIDGLAFPVRTHPAGSAIEISIDGRREEVWVVADHDTVFVHAFGRAWALDVINPVEAKLREGAGADAALAPMPGSLVSLAARAGDEVTEGQVVAVIESMKMQTEIKAPRDGVVERTPIAVGESFGQGTPLVVLVSEEEDE